jgi:hypothetical protein
MSELIDFAARLIELEGGAIEPTPSGLSALLPGPLSGHWGCGEELRLSETDPAMQRLAYGTELLERMLDTATSWVAIARARLELPAARSGQLQSAAEHWSLRNGLAALKETRLGPQTRLELFALATLQGDEKREFLVSCVLSAGSGTEVPGFSESMMESAAACAGPAGDVPEQVLRAALRVCSQRAEALAQPFREAMTRRFERDRERIEAYFTDLRAELDKRARRGKLDPQAVRDKRAALHADRGAKLEALAARFVLRIEMLPIALRCIEVPGAFITLILRRRKAIRTLELEYDLLTRRVVAPPCDGCGGPALRPAACDDAFHLLCETCVPRAEGRIACTACKPGQVIPRDVAPRVDPSVRQPLEPAAQAIPELR